MEMGGNYFDLYQSQIGGGTKCCSVVNKSQGKFDLSPDFSDIYTHDKIGMLHISQDSVFYDFLPKHSIKYLGRQKFFFTIFKLNWLYLLRAFVSSRLKRVSLLLLLCMKLDKVISFSQINSLIRLWAQLPPLNCHELRLLLGCGGAALETKRDLANFNFPRQNVYPQGNKLNEWMPD